MQAYPPVTHTGAGSGRIAAAVVSPVVGRCSHLSRALAVAVLVLPQASLLPPTHQDAPYPTPHLTMWVADTGRASLGLDTGVSQPMRYCLSIFHTLYLH